MISLVAPTGVDPVTSRFSVVFVGFTGAYECLFTAGFGGSRTRWWWLVLDGFNRVPAPGPARALKAGEYLVDLSQQPIQA